MTKAATKARAKAKATTAKAKAETNAAAKAKAKTNAAAKAPIYLTEEDVRRLVTVKDAIATLELLFATWPDPSTVNLPRQRAPVGKGTFNLMGAAWGEKQVFGLKAYYAGGNGARYHVLLYSSLDGKLKAMIEADNLGQLRTGAASGLATKLLAKPEVRTLEVIGAGRQAFTQVAAVCAARPIESVRVFSRTAEHREAFAAKSSAGLASRQDLRRPPRRPSAMPTWSSPSRNRRSPCCAPTG